MSVALKAVFVGLAAATAMSLPACTKPQSTDNKDFLESKIGQGSICTADGISQNPSTVFAAKSKPLLQDVPAEEKKYYMEEAKKSYQSAMVDQSPDDALNHVDMVRYNLALANGAALNMAIEPEWYTEIGLSSFAVLLLERKLSLQVAQQLMTIPRDEMTIYNLRHIRGYMIRAGYNLNQGEGFDRLGISEQEFKDLKREYAIKNASDIVESMKEGKLPQNFHRYDIENDIIDAGYQDNDEWYRAIGTTTEQFRKYVQAICAQGTFGKDCPVKEPGHNHLPHNMAGMSH